MSLLYVTPAWAAKKLRIHRLTIYRWIKDGKLKTVEQAGKKYKIRIARSEIDRIYREWYRNGKPPEKLRTRPERLTLIEAYRNMYGST